jgi:hypothetical protein
MWSVAPMTSRSREKYAALVIESVHIPGDERSRTNPGHGYPAHTIDNLVMHEFADLAALEAWVLRETASYPRKFRLIKYEDLEFERNVSVKVKGDHDA